MGLTSNCIAKLCQATTAVVAVGATIATGGGAAAGSASRDCRQTRRNEEIARRSPLIRRYRATFYPKEDFVEKEEEPRAPHPSRLAFLLHFHGVKVFLGLVPSSGPA
jgi:hypothetical protein